MKYGKIVEGKFIDRPNRFIAHVEIAGKAETVHVKHTGRCRELLLPGAAVRLEQSDNPARKTLYDLVAVYKDRIGWINIDSQAPNIPPASAAVSGAAPPPGRRVAFLLL